MQQAIAVLDSGVGGLTVVKELMRQLPQEKVIYFGDTARSPYGPRSAGEVRIFTRQIVEYLIQFNPKMIVIACNTATAVAIEDIREQVSIPVIGVILPGARAAIKNTRSGIIGVIGTDGTIRSKAYEHALRLISPNIQVYSEACPLLAPFVEKGLFGADGANAIVEQSLRQLIGKPIDCLILGCTHYPFLVESISRVMGPEVTLISSADETAREISTILYHRDILASSGQLPIHQFFCSGESELFKKIAQNWLKEQISITPVVWQVPNIL
ncbi:MULTISPECIES: glutamate racemase [unclassified Paenibacillus]|uniref:glutamate racemase n=1 Tax=unclassified Paenibacillus TaxID=185978 RepID=UPI00070C335B|nr:MULTISPECIES: glutamate racemase [unclassified Paenibacillus]KQX47099.1 glutamate racemase [Paenibacillus sp. Root444D2]KRE48203.1 glutamate racemase [Paenibacillus sp. Soil724D2]